jgi:GT2 family glycosyltransferase
MKLSIVIVNWNSCDYVRECLKSIRATCDGTMPQVVVVDGGSFDGCAEMIIAEFPDVEFVQSQENIGFGRSNNLGFESAAGEMVLLLNPDTELRPGALEALTAALENQPQAGLIGARLLNTDGTLQLSAVQHLPTPFRSAVTDCDWARRRWWRLRGPRENGPPVEVEAVSGACMLLRSEVFRSLGGFDSRYFMYAEDMDLCCRVRRMGLRVYHAPQSVIVHHGGGSSRTQVSLFSVVMMREALAVYMRLNLGRAQEALYRMLTGLVALPRLALLAAAWLVARPGSRPLRLASLRKWLAALRWSLGLEKWAGEKFGHVPPRRPAESAIAAPLAGDPSR